MKILGHFYNMVYLFLAEIDFICLGGLIFAFRFAKISSMPLRYIFRWIEQIPMSR